VHAKIVAPEATHADAFPMTSELRSARRGSTLVLTISDAATCNVLTPQICAAGIEALAVAEADEAVSLVVVHGDLGNFSAGEALPGGAAAPGPAADSGAAMIDALHAWIDGLRAFPKPVVAAVEGTAADAGLALALACDVVVAAHDARFVMTGAAKGRMPLAGLSWHLGQRLPRALALQWLWLGATVEAAAMRELGLVAAITQQGTALDEALRLGERLAAAPLPATIAVKELVDASRVNMLTQHLDLEKRRRTDLAADRASSRASGPA
jgi:enoyl-CoA hydratase/carnithine racemase